MQEEVGRLGGTDHSADTFRGIRTVVPGKGSDRRPGAVWNANLFLLPAGRNPT